MSWFMRLSRFASAHLVKSQDKNMSCAMASICMVNFKAKKGLMLAGMAAGSSISAVPIPGASYVGQTLSKAAIEFAVKSEKEVYALYEKHKGSAHDFDLNGANRTFYPLVLADLGLGNWETVNVGQGALAQAAIDATKGGAPAMLSVTWDGGGGHAVVVDETHGFFGTDYLCICDPWDGELRIIAGNKGGATAYDASDKPISLTLWGDRHGYTPGSTGSFNGWITRRK